MFYVLGAVFIYSLLYHTQLVNCITRVNKKFDSIRTTAPFNSASNTYDIPPNTPFDVICVYSNLSAPLDPAVVSISNWEIHNYFSFGIIFTVNDGLYCTL